MEQGFLDALREAPDDLVNHLVYADWLDDHGQDERAAYIRAWADIERMPPAARVERHNGLAKQHTADFARWLGPTPAPVTNPLFAGAVLARANFHTFAADNVAMLERFAVREAVVSLTPTVQAAVKLPALAHLRELIVSGRPNEEWLCSSLLPPLRRLSISGGMDTALGRLMARTPRLASLRCLEAAYGNTDDAGVVALLRSRHLHGLERWHVNEGRVTGMSLWHLFAGGRTERWRGLTFAVRNTTLAELVPIGRCKNLEALRVLLPAHLDSDPTIGFLGPLERLRDLRLEGHVGPAFVRWLGGWPGLARLHRLAIPEARRLDPESLRRLLESPHRSHNTLFDLPGVAA